MARRQFLPPAVCSACEQRPALGNTLLPSGSVWLCPACLTQGSEGESVTSKAAQHSIKADMQKSLFKRAKSAGDIESSMQHENNAIWHSNVLSAIQDHGNIQKQSVVMANGEVVPNGESSWYKDTLADPDIAALDASNTRGRLLEKNNITALALDVSNTVKASNSAEKMISHQIALAHQIALNQAAQADKEHDSKIEMKRLHIVARMMSATQELALTLHKLKSSAPQSVTVQHVHVQSGGQAVVGNVQK